MPESLGHIQDGEDLGPMQSCGYILNCGEGIVLPPDSPIKVLWVEA